MMFATMSNVVPPAYRSEASPERAIRDALLVRLCVPQGAGVLLENAPDFMRLDFPEVRRVHVLVAGGRSSTELADGFREAAANDVEHNLQVVLLGGSADVRVWLTTLQRQWMGRRLLEVFQLTAEGELWSGPFASDSSPLAIALRGLASGKDGDTQLRASVGDAERASSAYVEAERDFDAFVRARRIGAVVAAAAMVCIVGAMRIASMPDSSFGATGAFLASALALLAFVGIRLERVVGPVRFAAVAVCGAIAGVVASFAVADASEIDVLATGLAGGLGGVPGAAIGLRWFRPDAIPRPWRTTWIVAIVSCFYPGSMLLFHVAPPLSFLAGVGASALLGAIPRFSAGLRVLEKPSVTKAAAAESDAARSQPTA